MNPLDNYLGIHPRALTLEAQRTELLAANLANVDTPNYKARDIDFQAALAAAAPEASGVTGTPSAGSGAAGTAAANANGVPQADVKYRVPLAPSLDGNTVDEQLEQAAFAENSVRYQATLTLLNGKLRALMTAITGQ